MGDRVKAAGVHESCSRRQRRGVVAQVGLIHELGLPAQVQVVGACGSARGHDRIAMLGVGPDGGHEHACGLGQTRQRPSVGGVDGAQPHLAREASSNSRELDLAPASQREARPIWRS